MNKNIRKIIGITLTLNFLACFASTEEYVGITKAFASSENGIDYLDVNKGASTSNITLYSDSSYKKSVKFNEDTKMYYAETSMNSINLDFKSIKGYEVKAFKSDKDTATAYDAGETMALSSGLNIIYVRTYEKGDFDASEVQDKVVKEYQIYVTRNDGVQEDNEQDKIYLKDITLSVGDLSFDKKITTYDSAIEVSGNSEITIKAKPEEDGDKVRINNSTVDSTDDYKKEVRVRLGKNTYKIEVSNDDGLKRVYTVNVIRGDDVSVSSSSNNENTLDSEKNDDESKATVNNNSNSDVKNDNLNSASYRNQWVQENGLWKYYDVTGSCLKNTWFTDMNSGKEYYFYADGQMATNWIVYNNSWYFMGQDGAKVTGWKSIGGNWYYLNSDGTMKTGWLKDNNGKWYYLYNTGVMAQDTIIDGYKLGSDGCME